MEITKHILTLLQFNECVIIPEFGAFISNYIPAKFDQVNHTFSPPKKAIVFNSKICNNDGLLINHIVENENISYNQGQLTILSFVDGLYSDLNKGETVRFDNLGTFKFDKAGAIVYNPIDNFELISAYGLQSFSYQSIDHSNNFSGFKSNPAIRAINGKKDILKIAASITLLLSLSLFPLKNNTLELQSSNLNPLQFLSNNEITNKTLTKTENMVAVETFNGENNQNYDFTLVGGSFQYFDNANQLQRDLLNEGHKAEIIEQDNGYFRVIIDSFSNKNEALNARNNYLTIHPNSKVWVSKR